ncbi:hypothetical protein OBBRIDRAFT_201909 [Obba rivulosa]|uniref:Uncharacterized protein n=1 Tax=Obba rivulosa TaxID=1052685 RepID=A0A8E2DHB3_9APHY|nr:hypothetical protein OBBRIDRAFT_201909 [Obba rivulosa]
MHRAALYCCGRLPLPPLCSNPRVRSPSCITCTAACHSAQKPLARLLYSSASLSVHYVSVASADFFGRVRLVMRVVCAVSAAFALSACQDAVTATSALSTSFGPPARPFCGHLLRRLPRSDSYPWRFSRKPNHVGGCTVAPALGYVSTVNLVTTRYV